MQHYRLANKLLAQGDEIFCLDRGYQMQAAFDSPVRNPNHYPESSSFPFYAARMALRVQ